MKQIKQKSVICGPNAVFLNIDNKEVLSILLEILITLVNIIQH